MLAQTVSVFPQGRPGYAPPSGDINAPDLYLPLMSFITFVLITGLLKGTKEKWVPRCNSAFGVLSLRPPP